jgi:hypothetical protein
MIPRKTAAQWKKMTRKQRKESLREMGEQFLARFGWPNEKPITTALLEQTTGRKAPENR